MVTYILSFVCVCRCLFDYVCYTYFRYSFFGVTLYNANIGTVHIISGWYQLAANCVEAVLIYTCSRAQHHYQRQASSRATCTCDLSIVSSRPQHWSKSTDGVVLNHLLGNSITIGCKLLTDKMVLSMLETLPMPWTNNTQWSYAKVVAQI